MKKTENRKVVFWGAAPGNNTASNLAAVAGYLAYQAGYQILIRQTAGAADSIKGFFSANVKEASGERELLLQPPKRMQNGKRMLFIHCGRQTDERTRQLLRKADLVVVNLRQSAEAFDLFFLQYVRISAKCMYLVGSYQAEDTYHRKRLQQEYRIPPEQLGVIPFNPEFQFVCERGKLDKYMCREARFYLSENRRRFLKELNETVNRMIKQFT